MSDSPQYYVKRDVCTFLEHESSHLTINLLLTGNLVWDHHLLFYKLFAQFLWNLTSGVIFDILFEFEVKNNFKMEIK